VGLFGFAAVAPGPLAAAAGCPAIAGLEARLHEGEVLVELHEVASSPIKEGCAIGWVPAPVDEVLEVIWNAEAYEEFLPHVADSSVAVGSGGEVLNTQVLALPFPIRDRHYTVRLERQSTADGGAEVRWTYVAGSGNVDETRGSWRLDAEGDSTWVTYRVLTDPGGMVPKWAANRAARKTLPDVLRAVRERVAERRSAAALGVD